MAILEFGPLVTKARGSIRGTTFSAVIGGQTARGRPHPHRPGRTLQFANQRLLSNAAAAWSLVTPANKALWTTYAASVILYNRLTQAFTPTGQMMFIRCAVFNQLFCQLSTPPSYNPISVLAVMALPALGGLPGVPVPVFDLNSNNLRIASWTTPPAASDTLIFSIYKPSNIPQAAKRFLLSQLLVLGSAGTPITLASAFSTAFPSGTTFTVKVRFSLYDNTARVSNSVTKIFTLTKP
jgi:hypothetical protein